MGCFQRFLSSSHLVSNINTTSTSRKNLARWASTTATTAISTCEWWRAPVMRRAVKEEKATLHYSPIFTQNNHALCPSLHSFDAFG